MNNPISISAIKGGVSVIYLGESKLIEKATRRIRTALERTPYDGLSVKE